MERLVNGNAVTALNGSITSGATTLTVDDASLFPSAGTFRIRIGTELLIVTAVSGNDFTVTRGGEGSSAAAHADNEPVEFCLSAGSYEDFMAEYVSQGAWASRPSSGDFAGQLYLATDAPFMSLWNGSAWEDFGPAGIHKMQTTGFSLVNGGTLTNNGAIYLASAASTTDAVRAWTVGYSGTPKSLIARLDWSYFEADFAHAGLCWRESSSGKLALHGCFQTSLAARFFGQKFTDPATYASDYGTFVGSLQYSAMPGRYNWLKVTDNGTDRIFYVGCNGREWIELHRVSRTDFLTPNEFGLFVKANNNVESKIRCTYLSIE